MINCKLKMLSCPVCKNMKCKYIGRTKLCWKYKKVVKRFFFIIKGLLKTVINLTCICYFQYQLEV